MLQPGLNEHNRALEYNLSFLSLPAWRPCFVYSFMKAQQVAHAFVQQSFMLSIRLVLLSGLLFLFFQSSGQSPKIKRVNTSGIEAYFNVANVLKSGTEVGRKEWQELFQSPVYQMMIAGGAIDTSLLKAEMQQVYGSSIASDESSSTPTLLYHKAYKDSQAELAKYTSLLHKANVADSVKSLLYPFLPKRLQSNELFPQLYYVAVS